MSSLSPCSSPAWHAPVCEDQSVSQRSSRWVPSRSQRAMTGALPSRSARRSTSWARPSISRKTTPGTSEAIAPARRAWRRTTLRCQVSSSSMASSAEAAVVMIAIPTATTTPANQPSMLAPGLIAAAMATSPPLSTSAAPPSVSTLSGRARRLSVGQTSALSTAAMTAVTSAPAGAVDVEVRQQRAEHEQGAPVQEQDHQAADGESPEPGHGASLARARVIAASPAAGDDVSPQRSLASRTTPTRGRTMADVAQMAKEWWLLAVLGVVSLVCGVLAIAYPDVTLLAVGIIFGFYLLMAGVFELVDAIVGDPASRALSAIVGIVALLAGLICLRRPGDSLLALVVVLGAYLIVTGVARLVRAFASVEHRGLVAARRGHRPHPGHPHPLLARREPRHAGRVLRHLAHLPRRRSPWSRPSSCASCARSGSADVAPPITAAPA